MSETKKDPGIILFGRKIPLPECQIPANSGAMDSCGSLKKTEAETPCAENSEQQENNNTSDSREGPKHNNVNENDDDDAKANSKPVEDTNTETSSTDDQDKILKKPDKIIQCPRCNSFDTKFCYFNNYNVNQPRHFCKNCQRYWTAGGTMRNVPVGAGRRKHKHLASQYRHIIVSSGGVPSSRLEATDSSPCHHQQHISAQFNSSSTDNGTVLKFGPDTPLCESMESMLNLRDQKRCIDAGVSINCAEYAEESISSASLCGSSVTNVSTQGNNNNESSEKHNNRTNWLKCYPVPPWMLPWNINSYGTNGPNPMQWCPTPMVPVQFVPAPYWNGTPMWGSGTVSIGSSNPCLSPSSSTSNSCCTGNNNGSQTLLGKHTRDAFFIDEEKSEKFVLVPKAPRIIDDTNEASKSHNIWATFAIMHDKKQHCVSNGGDILKKTESDDDKGAEGKDHSVLDVSQIMEANPAAISRVHAFQESI